MAESWARNNASIKQSDAWKETITYVNKGGTWVNHAPYVASPKPEGTGTQYHLRMGYYSSNEPGSTRGYDPESSDWADKGDLTPTGMLHYYVWRMKRSSGGTEVTLQLTASVVGSPPSVFIVEATTMQRFDFTQDSGDPEKWLCDDAALSAFFDGVEMDFYYNDPDLSLPPMEGDYWMRIGQQGTSGHWPESNRDGYESDDPGWVDGGEMVPNEIQGHEVSRFYSSRTGIPGETKIDFADEGVASFTMRFADGQTFPFDDEGDGEFTSQDPALNTVFFENEEINFYVDATFFAEIDSYTPEDDEDISNDNIQSE